MDESNKRHGNTPATKLTVKRDNQKSGPSRRELECAPKLALTSTGLRLSQEGHICCDRTVVNGLSTGKCLDSSC